MSSKLSTFGTSHTSKIWLSVDCCGLAMAIVTWFLIGYAVFVVSDVLYHWKGATPEFLVLEGIMVGLASLCYLSHIRAMLTNPGAVPYGARPLPDREEYEQQPDASSKVPYRSWCRRCESYKPPRAHHDSCTDRCVSKMDHFCPWVNNCVGVLNHKLFILFLLYIFLISLFSLTVVVARATTCASSASHATPSPVSTAAPAAMARRSRRRPRHDDSAVVRIFEAFFDSGECHMGLPVFFLVMEGMLFMLFTMAMMCDQYHTIATGIAGIDRRKGIAPSKTEGVHEVFGGSPSFGWHWLWPSPPDFGKHRDRILGYLPPRDDGAKDELL